MLKKINNFLNETKMVIVSGIFFLLSLILLILKAALNWNISNYLDPIWITIIISGYPLFYKAIYKLVVKKTISSPLLISIAMLSSIVIGEVFAAGEIAFIMTIGEILEDKTVDKAKKGLENLINLSPKNARIILDSNKTSMLSIDEVKLNMIVRVLPGESIPVDGIIISGTTSIDQALITGESLPCDKTIGDKVYCGTINCNGSIDIKVLSENKSSSLQKMINLVEEAENNKAPTQRIADKWASILVPVALLLSIIVGIATYFIIGNSNNAALIRAVTILVVFCPCALALATPTSVMAGIGQATKYGVIIKSGKAIEDMGKVNCVAFDKTGTLTEGKPQVSDVISFSNLSINDLIIKAASIEAKSEHPLAKAILNYANEKKLEVIEVSDFKTYPGYGVSGIVNKTRYVCGNLRHILNSNISISDENLKIINKLSSEGKALIIIADNSNVLGVIALSDTLKTESKTIINKLKQMNIKVVLLTGDNKVTASYFANMVGIDDVYADLLPEDKVNHIKKLQKDGYRVAMVGDGVNDAPALKTADVGISMGDIGSDITVEASSVALTNGSIGRIPYLCKLAKSTFSTIKFNITASVIINVIAIILSTLGVLNPITGALVHNAGSLLVILNATLIYNRNFNN